MVNIVPRWAYLLAISLSFALAAIVIVAFLQIGPTPATSHVVPPLACGLAALLFSLIWPTGSWRWGLFLSSGFWVFFVVVFFSYLSVGEPDWLSLVRGLSALLAGFVGAFLGTQIRFISRRQRAI
jgi:hypothetical protein